MRGGHGEGWGRAGELEDAPPPGSADRLGPGLRRPRTSPAQRNPRRARGSREAHAPPPQPSSGPRPLSETPAPRSPQHPLVLPGREVPSTIKNVNMYVYLIHDALSLAEWGARVPEPGRAGRGGWVGGGWGLEGAQAGLRLGRPRVAFRSRLVRGRGAGSAEPQQAGFDTPGVCGLRHHHPPPPPPPRVATRRPGGRAWESAHLPDAETRPRPGVSTTPLLLREGRGGGSGGSGGSGGLRPR